MQSRTLCAVSFPPIVAACLIFAMKLPTLVSSGNSEFTMAAPIRHFDDGTGAALHQILCKKKAALIVSSQAAQHIAF
jgi:hypothetical protein